MESKGLFITFEGIDGCGKSTQIRKFSEYLFSKNKHNHIVITREPFKEQKIREILKENTKPEEQAMVLADLFIKDREEHTKVLITPSLEKGFHVISDRYKLSTIAYQSAQNISPEILIKKQSSFPIPDITFIIDVPSSVSAQRMAKDTRDMHKFEKDLDFLEKVRQNFLKIKESLPKERIEIIDGTKSPEEIFEKIKSVFEKEFDKKEIKKYSLMSEVPEEVKRKLEKYFTTVGGDVFAITNLPPELAGGALARYSRAPTGMQLTIINEFLDEYGNPSQEKGSELMDRVLNAYGDESVGELEGAHLGIESVSQLLTKSIEDRRIGGSPIEQSTRYVKYDIKDEKGNWRYLRPKEILNSPFLSEYERVNNLAFEVYSEAIKRLIEYFKIKLPESEFEIEVERNGIKTKARKQSLVSEAEEKAFRNAYNFTVRCASLDVARCLLPSSTLTQLGIYGNGRFFTNLITFLKSGELEEEKERAKDIERELKKVIPTFIKRNREITQKKDINKTMKKIAKELFEGIPPQTEKVTLIEKENYLDEVISQILFQYTNISLKQIISVIKRLPESKKIQILESYTGKRENRRDRTGRGLEAGYPLTFDLVGSFAEYRDLERHRMLTQQKQDLTTEHGFILPPEIVEVGLQNETEEVVKLMNALNKKLKEAGFETASQYATLFNHRMRFMLGMNLREFQHLSELRTQPAGHFSYRSMVMEMADKVKKDYPWAEKTIQFVDYSDPGNKISRAKEQSRIAGKNISKGIDGGLDLV